jgi:hypothetical protein
MVAQKSFAKKITGYNSRRNETGTNAILFVSGKHFYFIAGSGKNTQKVVGIDVANMHSGIYICTRLLKRVMMFITIF